MENTSKCIYGQNGIDGYPSGGGASLLSSSPSFSLSSPLSSSPPPGSMGMIFADMGSLSISPSHGGLTSSLSSSQESSFCRSNNNTGLDEGRAYWVLPFLGKFRPEDAQNSDAGEGKGSSECSDGFGENGIEAIDLNASLSEEKPGENVQALSSAKDRDTGQSKLCARGHWRPAEDTKLRELVALYGPQNWNLIAEKLEGRSGN